MRSYRETRNGQLLEEGITEAGAMSAWTAAATSYSVHGRATLPFYIYYSMFGFQRVGDLIWAAADQRSRGFLLGATAGRTTLGGEGLQHQDGSSHVVAATVPTCRAYDPAFACELAVILDHGMRQMMERQEDVFYYITVMNENYANPSLPSGVEAQIVRGMYRMETHPRENGAGNVRLLGSGAILREVQAAAALLADDWNVASEVFSVTSFSELARDAHEVLRWNRLHPDDPPRRSHVGDLLTGNAPIVAATDYVRAYPELIAAHVAARFTALGTGRLRPQRHAQGAAAILRGRPAPHRGGRARGIGGQASSEHASRRRSQIRYRFATEGAVVRLARAFRLSLSTAPPASRCAHQQVEHVCEDPDHDDPHDHDVGPQEVRCVQHHLAEARGRRNHFGGHQRRPAETDGDPHTGQYLRHRRGNDDVPDDLPFGRAHRIRGVDLLDRHAADAGARRHGERRKARKKDQHDLRRLVDAEPDDDQRQIRERRQRPVELDRRIEDAAGDPRHPHRDPGRNRGYASERKAAKTRNRLQYGVRKRLAAWMSPLHACPKLVSTRSGVGRNRSRIQPKWVATHQSAKSATTVTMLMAVLDPSPGTL
jgi:hypothetical protein